MRRVKFKVLEVNDIVKQGSEVRVGAILTGMFNPLRQRIDYIDSAGCEWCFYVGDSAEILD
jgi:hypothetical protein